MATFALQIVTSLITGFAAALLTVHLSLKRFSAEKVWERKFTAYTLLLESLHHMRRDLDITLDALKKGREISEEREAKLNEAYQMGYAEIVKQADIGELIVSTEVTEHLRELESSLSAASDAQGYLDHIIMNLDAVNFALEKIREGARRDLQISGSFIRFRRAQDNAKSYNP